VVDGGLRDAHVGDLPDLLRPPDVLVFNDTRVVPARLTGKRGAVRIEVTLHKRVSADTWWAFARPAKRLRSGDDIIFAPGFAAEVTDKRDGGEVRVEFSGCEDVLAALELYGEIPLPPYIPREGGADARDRDDYQTVYATHDGAVAAPTAGLHFTDELLQAIDEVQNGRSGNGSLNRNVLPDPADRGSLCPMVPDDGHDFILRGRKVPLRHPQLF
jgi:S-adenosylmethionine:tRNA ribosyltransferase-isomerase